MKSSCCLSYIVLWSIGASWRKNITSMGVTSHTRRVKGDENGRTRKKKKGGTGACQVEYIKSDTVRSIIDTMCEETVLKIISN